MVAEPGNKPEELVARLLAAVGEEDKEEIMTAAGLAELRTWSKRVLTAPGLDDVFAGT